MTPERKAASYLLRKGSDYRTAILTILRGDSMTESKLLQFFAQAEWPHVRRVFTDMIGKDLDATVVYSLKGRGPE